jgi:DNA-directed RNA polymerase specialized sigma24 family protein
MQNAEMVDAILDGQGDGLAAAYDRYAPALYGYCRSILGGPADAGDAVQDTFIIAGGAPALALCRGPQRMPPPPAFPRTGGPARCGERADRRDG